MFGWFVFCPSEGEYCVKGSQDRAELERVCRSSGYLELFSFDVLPFVTLVRVERGRQIMCDGGAFDGYLYYLVEGRVKLGLGLPNGKTALLDFYRAPCFLGEMELLGVYGESFEVRALERCTLLALSAKSCGERLMGDSVFLRNLCVSLAGKERRRALALSKAQGFSLSARLADFVLNASCGGLYREKNTDAAAYLGVSYRHLGGTLAEFVREGLLVKEEGGYRIADERALARLAEDVRR